MQQSHVAEFRFPECGFEITGKIAQMDMKQLTVCFSSAPTIGERMKIPTRVDVYFMVQGILRVLGTQLQTIQGQVAKLTICEPVRQLHIRKDERYPVKSGLEFRASRGNSYAPIWHKAEMIDLSLGGLCFDLPLHMDTPFRLEVAFNLTDMWMQTIWQRDLTNRNLKEMDLSEEMKPFRFQGKVCHERKTENGKNRLGIQFVAMAPEEKIRMARILNDIFGE